jgi:hypothetical protein
MAKTFALGAVLKMGDGAPTEVFTAIPGPTDFSYTPPQADRIDVTDHDSSAREYLQGLAGEGELTSEFWWNKDEPMQVALRDKYTESQPTNFQLIFKSGTQVDFAATVQHSFELGIADAEKMSVTWAISGQPTYIDP